MPRKQREEELDEEILEEKDERRPSGGLDLYDENGELLEEGEPLYIEDEV